MKFYQALSRLWQPFAGKNISVYAAGASFYLFLSVLPASALLLSVIPYLPIPEQLWISIFEYVIPAPFLPVIFGLWEYIFSAKSLTAVSVSVVTTLWSASKGTLFIMYGLNTALDLPNQKGYLRRRIFAILHLLLLAACCLAILAFLFFLRSVLKYLSPDTSVIFPILGSFLLLSLVFAFTYFVVPAKKLPLKNCVWSGCAVSATWLLFSLIFTVYVNLFSDHRKVYGIIGLLILAAVWLRICVSVFLYGAVFTNIRTNNDYHPLAIIKGALSARHYH